MRLLYRLNMTCVRPLVAGVQKMLANKIYLGYNKNLDYIFIYRGSHHS